MGRRCAQFKRFGPLVQNLDARRNSFLPGRCNPWVPNGAVAPLGLAAKERWEHLLGPHGQSNHVTVHGRGGTAKRERFAVYGEAKDVELVPTRWSCTSKFYRQGPRVYPGALSFCPVKQRNWTRTIKFIMF